MHRTLGQQPDRNLSALGQQEEEPVGMLHKPAAVVLIEKLERVEVFGDELVVRVVDARDVPAAPQDDVGLRESRIQIDHRCLTSSSCNSSVGLTLRSSGDSGDTRPSWIMYVISAGRRLTTSGVVPPSATAVTAISVQRA